MSSDEERINPISEWQEIEEVEGATLFELQGPPRGKITDSKVVRTYRARPLSEELTCPICLGILRETMIVMECLHRFCSDCIQKCLRMGMKECPACRIHIGTRRSLRSDPNFDALIAAIFPDVEGYEERELAIITELNRTASSNTFAQSCAQGIVAQKRLRNKARRVLNRVPRKSARAEARRRNAPRASRSRSRRTRNNSSSSAPHTDIGIEEQPLVELVDLVLKRHPAVQKGEDLKHQYVTMPKQRKVRDIKDYLAAKCGPGTFNIYLTRPEAKILGDTVTVNALAKTFGSSYLPLVLHFCRA